MWQKLITFIKNKKWVLSTAVLAVACVLLIVFSSITVNQTQTQYQTQTQTQIQKTDTYSVNNNQNLNFNFANQSLTGKSIKYEVVAAANLEDLIGVMNTMDMMQFIFSKVVLSQGNVYQLIRPCFTSSPSKDSFTATTNSLVSVQTQHQTNSYNISPFKWLLGPLQWLTN